ncbi:MAG TPA: flagellar biosynthetic protein FliR [Fimbriimonadaceae bacterium]|nr:flagellar biosynthetic protein FliR [Fimbriimonadaceae bacterium]
MTEAVLWSFLLVFVRCSAMFLASPIFGAQTTPLPIRILTTLCISGALTCALNPALAPPPDQMHAFVMALGNECVAGLLIGLFMQLAIKAAMMGGSLLDLQIGLSMSQTLNPVAGVPVTVVAQYKFMLASVLFLAMNGHHIMLQAFAESYRVMPSFGLQSLPALQESIVSLVGQISLLAIQMAAPVLAVSLVVDAALGVVTKAVPQVHAMIVGMPAKIVVGLIAMSLALPALGAGVQAGVEHAVAALTRLAGAS